MSAVLIPDNLEYSYQQLTSTKVCRKKLNEFLRSPSFSEALLTHRRQFTNVSDKEYRVTLEVMLSFYKPGEPVGIKQLVKNTISELETRFKDRRLSQNEITTSFGGLLRESGIITGESTLKWSWLDTPNANDRLKATLRNLYTAYISQTEHEAQLKKAYRDATALRKMEDVVLSNRNLLDDITQQLEIINKMEKRCREKAMELNVPYSQVKEATMKKRKGNGISIKPLYFPILIGAVVLTGIFLSADNDAEATDPDAQLGAPVIIEEAAAKYGLSASENIWRSQYITLHKQYGGPNNTAMEEAMFALAAEHMISMARMTEIVKTITPEEVQ